MRILIICSVNSGKISPFVREQVDALRKTGVDVSFFTINGKGFAGYWKNRPNLIVKLNSFQPDIIHAHYGLSGVLANLQCKVPVVTTFHGCDINKRSLRVISFLPLMLSKFNIFVSKAQVKQVRCLAGKHAVIPCGVDFEVFKPMDKSEARTALGWNQDKKYILFSSTFDRPEKNAGLAKAAMTLLPEEYELVELRGFSRLEVMQAMNACDVGLLTSIREGSPMFIKEMLACKRPIVSTAVGDVEEQFGDVEGCFIVPFSAKTVAHALTAAMQYENIRVDESKYEIINNDYIAGELVKIYSEIINR